MHEVSNIAQDSYDIGKEKEISKEASNLRFLIGLYVNWFSSLLLFCIALVSSYVHANIIKNLALSDSTCAHHIKLYSSCAR